MSMKEVVIKASNRLEGTVVFVEMIEGLSEDKMVKILDVFFPGIGLQPRAVKDNRITFFWGASQLVKKAVLCCPHCQSTDVTEVDSVLAYYPISLGANDEIDYDVAEVDWETAKVAEVEDVGPYYCKICTASFEELWKVSIEWRN